MRAVTWQGRRNMSVEEVPDPKIEEPTDAVVEITSTGLCASDLHLYDPLTPFIARGDIVGHEPMGVVREVGSAVATLEPGDRVVVPFNISCGTCGVGEFATRHLPLDAAPDAYATFREKGDGMVKVVFTT